MSSKRTTAQDSVLIPTKLCRPKGPRSAVDRARLIERLDDALNRRILVVSAGPGFGKSTLAVQWLERRQVRSAWLCLEPLDSDPQRFAAYLVAALQEIIPSGLPRSKALLAAPNAPPWSYFSEVLVSEVARATTFGVLVLDDYHTIVRKEIDDLIETLVDHLPPSLHLLVLTRVDPPWPMGRWLANQSLSVLRSRDLRFSVEETAEFFANQEKYRLDLETIGILHRKTEGWVAGLKLAELALMGLDDPAVAARTISGADRPVSDYLTEAALATQSREVRELLCVAASLDRFCASLCDHVLSEPGREPSSRNILADLESRHLFVESVDDRRGWFRLHPLFRDLLLDRRKDLASPELLERIDRRAGEWLARRGYVEEALRHLVAVGELDAAGAVVGDGLDESIWGDRSRQALSRWISMFPRGAENGHPPLLVARGYERLVRWDLAGLADMLDAAERLDPEARASVHKHVEALASYLAYWRGDVDGAVRHARTALEARPRVGSLAWMVSQIYLAGGLALLGRRTEAIALLDEGAAACVREKLSGYDLCVTQAFLFLYGQELDQVRSRLLALLENQGPDPIFEFMQGHAYYLLGVEAYERNRLDEASDWFGRVENLRYMVPSRVYHEALIGLALVARATRDREGARTRASAARAWAVETGDSMSLRISESLELRLAIEDGTTFFGEHEPPPADDHQSCWLEVPSATWAERLIAEGSAEALPFVENALARMEQHHNDRQATLLSALHCVALAAAGHREAALAGCGRLLHRAASRRLVRTLLDRGGRMKALLDGLAKEGEHDDYRELVRGAFDEAASAPWSGRAADHRVHESLSYRELAVLELMAEHRTNKEIAAQLNVTADAIKKRAREVYRKLGVRGRDEAVVTARAWGILSDRRYVSSPASDTADSSLSRSNERGNEQVEVHGIADRSHHKGRPVRRIDG